MESAYVTKYNFKNISSSLTQTNGNISIDKIFSLIYEQSLSDILNHPEAIHLYVQKQMLAGNFQSFHPVKKRFNPNYVFIVNNPKFHKNNNCKFLSADFSNYLVPPEIKALGHEKVQEFQEFCESKKKEFEGKSDDVFWAHVGVRFGIHISPQPILYENSGIQDIGNMSIEELQHQINNTLKNSLKMLEDEGSAAIIKNYRYAPPTQSTLSKISNPERKSVVEQFFKLKLGLINSLFELYKKQTRSEGYILPINLLKTLEFEPCKGCWKQIKDESAIQ